VVRPISRPVRIELLQWAGLLAAPLAWAGQHLFGVLLSLAACGPVDSRWNLPQRALTIGVTAVAAATAAGGIVAAVAARRAVGPRNDEEPPPAGRIHFLAVVGITVSPLLLAIILMNGIGVSLGGLCHQS
jgi:hypothetical protein